MPTPNPNVAGPGPYRNDDAAWGCGWAWLWFWLFIIIIVFAGWGWGGWYGGYGGPWGWWGPREVPTAQAPAGHQQWESRYGETTQPGGEAGEFLGKTVTMSGQVEQVLSPHAFTLTSAKGGRHLLVIAKDEKTPTLKKGETVRITGTVERYDGAEIHKETGVDLSKVPANEFAGRPAVVASSVAANPGAS